MLQDVDDVLRLGHSGETWFTNPDVEILARVESKSKFDELHY